MAGFNRSFRQKVIDDYLNATGRNFFVASEFVDWLEDEPDNPVYPVFFGKSDEEAAREYRMMLARNFVNGLRIKVVVSPAMAASAPHIAVSVREPETFRIPAFVSPVSGRRDGGGYLQSDVMDPNPTQELYRQAAQSLTAWLERFGDVAKLAGANVAAVEQVLGLLSVAGAEADEAEAA